jgi:hypothetical protein
VLSSGEAYTCKIGLGLIDSTIRPTIYITYSKPFYDSTIIFGHKEYNIRGGTIYDTLIQGHRNFLVYSAKKTTPGDYHYGGLIHYRSNRGDMWLPFDGKFTVK